MNEQLQKALSDLMLTCVQLSTPKFFVTFRFDEDRAVFVRTPIAVFEAHITHQEYHRRIGMTPAEYINSVRTKLIAHVNKHTQEQV